jgi:hypothetical protein
MRTADLADSGRLATLSLVAWDVPGGSDMLVNMPHPSARLSRRWIRTTPRPPCGSIFYDGSKASAVEVSDGIIAALDTDTFEHYIPDIEAVVDFKNSDTDTYIPALRK